ncbi:MAG TPA: hypothetical protein VI997_04875, partial [Candidatus Thermoplasmatota archaeon]|nr:hypothetical protein [Candidatus Thermoplasmatota archaeon]
MNRVRSLALVLAFTMLLPIVPLPTAEAEVQRVSFRPQIVYTDVKTTNVLYLQRILQPSAFGTTDTRYILWTHPPTQDDVLRQDPYAVSQTVTNENIDPLARAIFELETP